jgi:hypothetical protein
VNKIRNFYQGWTERGNIFIASDAWGSLENILIDIENFVAGTLTFSFSDQLFSWTVDQVNHFKNYLSNQTLENNENNRLFRQFWQEQFNCYLVDGYSSQSDVQCDPSCKLTDDICSGKVANQPLFLEDTYGKNIVMAALSVAYSIREAKYVEEICKSDDCVELFDSEDGRERFFTLLKKTEIPTRVGSMRKDYLPFLPDGNGKVNYIINNIVKDNINIYKEVYSVQNGEFVQLSNPTFYRGGEIDSLSPEECSSCECLLGTGAKNDTVAATTVTTPTESSNYIIAVLVVAVVVLLLICVTLGIMCRNLHPPYSSMTKSYRSSSFPMEPTSTLHSQGRC